MSEYLKNWSKEGDEIRKLATTVMPEFMKGRYSSDHWDMPYVIDIVRELVKRIDKTAPDTKWLGH